MTIEATKIINLLQSNDNFISVEFFPPKTEKGIENLYKRQDRILQKIKPLFSDITWGAGGSTSDLTLTITQRMHESGHVANMHLTCTNMEKGLVLEALQKCKDMGVRNIVALRGDPPVGEEWKASEEGFTCALDLLVFIRQNFGDYFGISVSGYPEGHPNAITKVDAENLTPSEKIRCSVFEGETYVCLDNDYEKELSYLKKKVDAGADFIITQMFFDASTFLAFVGDCRRKGITCPIVPGILFLNNYAGFQKMTNFCRTRVPATLAEKMFSLKDSDDKAIKEFGIDYCTKLCKTLLDSGLVPGLHFYTLNQEFALNGVLEGLGILHET